MSYDGEYDAREYPFGINGPRMVPQVEANARTQALIDENRRLTEEVERLRALLGREGSQ